MQHAQRAEKGETYRKMRPSSNHKAKNELLDGYLHKPNFRFLFLFQPGAQRWLLRSQKNAPKIFPRRGRESNVRLALSALGGSSPFSRRASLALLAPLAKPLSALGPPSALHSVSAPPPNENR